MVYGRSIRACEAIENGEGPASVVARWISNGCSAAWIARYTTAASWHHVQANLGGDGRPCDFYDRGRVLAAWLSANLVAAHKGDRTACRRIPALRALRVAWGVRREELDLCERTAPPVAQRREADPLVGCVVLLSRRYSERTSSRRRRYEWYEQTIRCRILAATPAQLTLADAWEMNGNVCRRLADGKRIGRKTIVTMEVQS